MLVPYSVSPSLPNRTIAKATMPEVIAKPINNSNEVVASPTSVDQTKQETKPVIAKNSSTAPSSIAKPNTTAKTADLKQPVSNITKSTSSVATKTIKPPTETKKQEIAAGTKTSSVAAINPVAEKKEIKTEPVAVVSDKTSY